MFGKRELKPSADLGQVYLLYTYTISGSLAVEWSKYAQYSLFIVYFLGKQLLVVTGNGVDGCKNPGVKGSSMEN